MDDHDPMDVDETSEGLPSSSSSSSSLNLEGVNLDELNNSMKGWSGWNDWGKKAEADPDNPRLLADILMYLAQELGKTDLKNSVITIPSPDHSSCIITGFNTEQLRLWKAGMRSGLETGDWAELIKHPILRIPGLPSTALGVPIQYQGAVMRAWRLKYYGDAHLVLLKAIDNLHNLPAPNNYAKLIPIAQSSGTGKSKTVDEIAKMRILFPLCLREDVGEDQYAYPLTDKVVRDHLHFAPSTKLEEACKQYFRSLLSALFALAHLRAQELFHGRRKVAYSTMAKAFYDLFADQQKRDEFYQAVVEKAAHAPYHDVWKSLNELEDGLKERCTNWPDKSCPILISIDEVHVLYTHRPIDTGSVYTLYARLKSVLNEGVSHDLGVVSLSTTTHLSSLAPPKAAAPSMREKADGRILPAPFTELPFDVYIIKEPLAPDQETLTSVGSLKFTAKFGRPLFYASYLSREKDSNIVDGIMRNNFEKLSGRSWPPVTPAVMDVSSIAILSARLLLDLSPSAASAKRYEEELVRNHMRMLYSVHEDRETIVTGTSPEPLIAEVSAQIMNHFVKDAPYMDLWGLLGNFVDHGLASQGAIGELIGRALSISAMDRAINNLREVCELKYQTPVTVADYYKALLTDQAWEALRRSVPANRMRLSNDSAKKTFEDAFRHAYFHFSHYGKANDSSPMRDTHAWALWLRGTAVVCQLNQELTDRMTPIYFSDRGSVSPETVSVNLDQDKTGQSVNPTNVAIQSAEGLSIFSQGNKLPYIAAVHCYALTERQGISVTQPTPQDLRSRKRDEEAPRYQIDFRGLEAYDNINDAVRIKIRAMINRSKNAVFNNHSRNYAVYLLRRMLPVLTADPASMEWFSGKRKANQIAGPSTQAPRGKRGRR